MFDSSNTPRRIVDVLAIHSDLLDKHARGIPHLIKAQFNSIKFYKHNPHKALVMMAPCVDLTVDVLEYSFNGLKLPNERKNRGFLMDQNSPIKGAAKNLNDILFRERMIKEKVDVIARFTSQFLSEKGKQC